MYRQNIESDPLSQIPRSLLGDNSGTKLKADYTVFLKREDEEQENNSLSTFKGLLFLEPKERKGYPFNLKGLPLCFEKWTMPKKKTKSALWVGAYQQESLYFAAELSLRYTSLVACWWSVTQPKPQTLALSACNYFSLKSGNISYVPSC